MSNTEVLETSGEPSAATQVTAYVAAVRTALADLAPDEVEDLTGGMEADLSELLAERGGLLEEALGSPGRYAVELRQAAGLPEAPVPSGARTIDLGAWWRTRRAVLVHQVDGRPWLRATVQFLGTLRPAWWVLRGVVAAWLFLVWLRLAYLPTYLMWSWALFVFGVPAVVGSVLLGRWIRRQGETGERTDPAWGRMGLRLGNVVAVIAALVGLANASPQPVYVESGGGNSASYSPSGLFFDNQPVDNLYVYDAQGHRLTDVRLFGADGKSITLDRSTDASDPAVMLPGRADVYGQWWTNVFPRAYTTNGDPYGLDPAADPASPLYGGRSQWKPPPSMAPLAPAPLPPPSAGSATAVPGAGPSGSTTASTTAPTTPSTTASTSVRPGPSTRPATPPPAVSETTLPGGVTVTVTGTPAPSAT